MPKRHLFLIWFALATMAAGCGGSDRSSSGGPGGNDTYDVDRYGIPKFVTTDYLDLSGINMISRFRSAAGHDYADDFESCRSMKHYFWPFGGDPGMPHTPSWGTILIHSPVQGTVSTIFQEWAGTQIQIRSKNYPAFYFIIFHVSTADSFKLGDEISEGQLLGTHIGDQTMSDISVGVTTPGGWKRISYFDVMTDSLFHTYQSRGIVSRDSLIISKAARDADPLNCSGESFMGMGTIDNWVILN